ncbi:hypothetical protein [Flammeovirga sp. SJP92]|uniref:hypothetical protein n=1 Tax=Flammeovirga sp. SJP92 TaxID=1775430 RepID=UPI0007891DDD|nr:hypothetical protein [Flammeovirga sp. SJP92]KXX68897.1 hypothetical protein AVL50_17200 [Flammeovirga sp. SJP92]
MENNTIQNNFNVSTNILRDTDVDIKYIVTPNAKSIFDRIIQNYTSGVKSFNIIGSYGTGKSTFAWAFEKNLSNQINFFGDQLSSLPVDSFEFIKFVGESTSFKKSFIQFLELADDATDKDIFDALRKVYAKTKKNNQGLIILVDEFGKYLEYAASHNASEELYFIQQVAEFCNTRTRNTMFITTLHQNFSSYASGLTLEQKQEWDKVKGRIKELVFNEPIEQLLFLSAHRLKERFTGDEGKINQITDLLSEHKVTDKNDKINRELVKDIFPLDYFSAEILVKSLQRYGQNERSLFTFLDVDDSNSIYRFPSFDVPFYNLSNVYDYLADHYETALWTKSNPNLTKWNILKYALEKVESRVNQEYVKDALSFVKVIGLINIFMHQGGNANYDFLKEYAELSLGITNADQILQELEKKHIIRYVNYATRYVFVDGTDIDIEQELLNASQEVDQIEDVVSRIKEYFTFTFSFAKKAQYETGTPRIFEYVISKKVESSLVAEGEIDGFINLVFNKDLNEKQLINESKINQSNTVFVWFKDTIEILNTLYELDKLKYLKRKHSDDTVAVRELDDRSVVELQKLNFQVKEGLYDTSKTDWYYNGAKKDINSLRQANILLSEVISEIYPNTPVLRNDLFNKHKISGAIATARIKFIDAFIENQGKELLGFPKDKFPPEKSIFMSLLHNTGMYNNVKHIVEAPKKDSPLAGVWSYSNEFLEDAKLERLPLTDFIERLKKKPYKLKQGFIDFWLPVFLVLNKDKYAFFNEGGYVPVVDRRLLDLVYKDPKKYFIKAFDFSGDRLEVFNLYRGIINSGEIDNNPTGELMINTFVPLIQLYRKLPDITRNTKNLSPKTINFRNAISNAKDPESALFITIPEAFGFDANTLIQEGKGEEFVEAVTASINELISFEKVQLKVFEEKLLSTLGYKNIQYPQYRELFENRYSSIDVQKIKKDNRLHNFYKYGTQSLDFAQDYLSRLMGLLLGKNIKSATDVDLSNLPSLLTKIIRKLDQLVVVHESLDTASNNEEIYNVMITREDGSSENENIIISTSQSQELEENRNEIKSIIDKSNLSPKLRKALLAQLLNETLNNE